MFATDLFRNHRILVTGGGTGLGREMAAKLLSLGADIYIGGRREAVLAEAADALMAEHGGSVKYRPLDIRDPAAIDGFVEWIWDDGGPLTGLLNNAAGNFISRTEDISAKGFNAVAGTVFHGTFYMTNAVGKRWIAAGVRGSVLSIIVTWVWHGSPFVVPSAMAKAGVHIMTKSLATEWGRYGIRLNAIAPGMFPTEGMLARLRPDEGQADAGAPANPMGRHGQMHEIQNLAAFLLADGCEWLTGQTIALDGAGHLLEANAFGDLFAWGDAEWTAARASIQTQNAKDRAAR